MAVPPSLNVNVVPFATVTSLLVSIVNVAVYPLAKSAPEMAEPESDDNVGATSAATLSVVVPELLVSTPSVTCHVTVRLGSLPPLVGSPLVGVKV